MVYSSKCMSILHITDTHIMAAPDQTLLGVNTSYYLNAVLDSAMNSERKFDLCLVTGDIAQDPYASSYRYFLNVLQRLNIPCVCLPGNHDDPAMMEQILCTGNVNCQKQLFLGNWQVICLNSQIPDSADGHLPDQELAFLAHCLSTNPDHFSLIAVHHHCVPTGSTWMDTMMIKNAQAFLSIIARYPNAKAVINGHIHQGMAIQKDSLRVLTTPSTCFQFKPLSEEFSLDDTSPGYRWIDLYKNGDIESEIVRIPEKITGLRTNMHGY